MEKKEINEIIEDYEKLMCHVTGNLFSKYNTRYDGIIEAYEEKRENDLNTFAKEVLEEVFDKFDEYACIRMISGI